MLASFAFSAAFVGRSAAMVDGKLLFTLFDDAAISMRYARNLVEGHGLVWNPGQPPVEGYSNFAWTLVMALTHLLPLPDRLAAVPIMVVGAVLLALEVVLVWALAARLAPERPAVAAAAAFVSAAYYPLSFWTLRGFEVAMAAVLLTGAILVAVRPEHSTRSYAVIGLLLAGTVLTRDDLAVPAAVIAAYTVTTARHGRRWASASSVLIPLAAGVAHTVFRLMYYGAALPNTYYLKLSGVPFPVRVHRGIVALLHTGSAHLIVVIALSALVFALRHRRVPAGAWLLAACCLSVVAYSVVVGGDAWESMLYSNRFLTPILPLAIVLAMLGVENLVSAPRRSRAAAAALAALAVVGATVVLISRLLPRGVVQLPASSATTVLGQAAWFLPALAVLSVLAVTGRVRREVAALAFVATATLLSLDGPAVTAWIRSNAAVQPADVAWARYGLALRAATQPDIAEAVSSAGNIGYFSRRPAIDLLGKSDPVIAHSRPVYVAAHFLPGHSKWHYDYSIGKLRPPIVAQIFGPVPADALRAWGYERVGALWYLPQTTGIDVERLRAAAALAR